MQVWPLFLGWQNLHIQPLLSSFSQGNSNFILNDQIELQMENSIEWYASQLSLEKGSYFCKPIFKICFSAAHYKTLVYNGF